MIDKLYVVYDRIALEGCPPFAAKNDGVAQRNFDGFLRGKVGVADPNDFRLYCVGSWDSERMLVEALGQPREVFPTSDEVKEAQNG